MDMNKTTRSSSLPKTDTPRAFTEATEKNVMHTKETYEKMSAAGTEATEVIKTSYSIAVKGAHEYNDKFIEFAKANTDAAFEFFDKLSGVKSRCTTGGDRPCKYPRMSHICLSNSCTWLEDKGPFSLTSCFSVCPSICSSTRYPR